MKFDLSDLAYTDIDCWCKTSPVLIKRWAFSISNAAYFIVLDFINLSKYVITDLYIKIDCKQSDGQYLGSINFSYNNLHAESNGSFGNKTPINIANRLVKIMEFTVTKIVFEDGHEWNNDIELKEMHFNPEEITFIGDLYDQWKREFSSKAVYKPVVKEDYWYCTCGQFNIIEQNNCCACGANRQKQLEYMNEASLRKRLEKFELEQEFLKAEREKKKALEEEMAKKRSDTIFKIFIVFICILILMVIFALITENM